MVALEADEIDAVGPSGEAFSVGPAAFKRFAVSITQGRHPGIVQRQRRAVRVMDEIRHQPLPAIGHGQQARPVRAQFQR